MQRFIGVSRPRIDSREKVTGAIRYAADMPVAGLLHARIVPSLYAHARIRAIDATAALAVPGVVAVLTARDLPIVGRGDSRRFEPVARDEAVFAGQPVALVVAETEAAAEDAVALVAVDVEQLEAVMDVVPAMAPGAPLARLSWRPSGEEDDANAVGGKAGAAPHDEADDQREGDADEDLSDNVLSHSHEVRGDPAAAFARCDEIVSGRFVAGWAYQAYLEPHAAIAWVDPDGTLALTSSTQGAFVTRDQLAEVFGLPLSRVRVTPAPLGGGFGSKVMVVEPLVAAAALRLRRPVRLAFSRQEDFAATNPAQGCVFELRIGARRDGRFEAVEGRLIFDTGAYPDESWEWFAAMLATGPYRWPAFDVRGYGVRTNRFPTGNYRAPTGPQGTFALESLVDELAGRLDLDPLELRQINLAVEGDPKADGDPWPRTGASECLKRLALHPLWSERANLPAGEGIGLAIGVWPGSYQPAAAVCRLEPDGTIAVITGVADLSGSTSSFALIAAEAFGVSPDAVHIVTADTASAPPSPSSNASAITYGAGPAVLKAAADAREQLLRIVAMAFEIDPGDLEIVDGMVQPRGSSDLGRPVVEFAEELTRYGSSNPPVEGHGATAHIVNAPSAAGGLVHVRVDKETGAIELLRYLIVQDAGRAINPALVEGQMLGGSVQSIGRALSEELVHDGQGQLLTGTFLDYAVPKASMLPPIETQIVEVPAPEGPFGARGVGEASMLPAPAAIANAVAAATGVRLRELPMTPRRLWAELRGADGNGR